MCSINGVYKGNGSITQEEWDNFSTICSKAKHRGRDSFGYCAFDSFGEIVAVQRSAKKFLAHTQLNIEYPDSPVCFVMSNNRAEPTTEFVSDKDPKDVQPYKSTNGRFYVVHNGTIANDKELKVKYEMSLPTDIDSAVIPELFFKKFGKEDKLDVEKVASVLREELVGSYSLCVYDKEEPDALYLATNYKPLYIERVGDCLYFTSLKEFFGGVHSLCYLHRNIAQVPPYSVVKIKGLSLNVASLREPSSEVKKALVVCSGGLDSTTVAKKMQNDGYDVTLLHFQYSCNAEGREVQAIKDIAKDMKVPYMFVKTDIFKDVIQHSPILDPNSEIAEGDKGVEFAHEWVPARNLIMLSIATGIAEAKGFDVIALGNNLEESGAYPDNEEIFIHKFAEVLPYAVNCNAKVEVVMPLGNLMKHEIVALGVSLKAPLDKTWSCYHNGELHCGKCGPCKMRRTAFQMLDIPELITYQG